MEAANSSPSSARPPSPQSPLADGIDLVEPPATPDVQPLGAEVVVHTPPPVTILSKKKAIQQRYGGFKPNMKMIAKPIRQSEDDEFNEGDDSWSSKRRVIKNPINAAHVHNVLINADGSRSAAVESYRPTYADEEADELRKLRMLLDRESRLIAREVSGSSHGPVASAAYSRPQYGLVKSRHYTEQEAWNSSAHRAAPHPLRGMTPLPGMSQNDPWASATLASCSRDHMLVLRVHEPQLRAHQSTMRLRHSPTHSCRVDSDYFTTPFATSLRIARDFAFFRSPTASYATSSFMRLDDGMMDDPGQAARRRKAEQRSLTLVRDRPEWDSTPWHYVPPALKGVIPVTPEPWARDQKLSSMTSTLEADERRLEAQERALFRPMQLLEEMQDAPAVQKLEADVPVAKEEPAQQVDDAQA
jgi:hypothetical protein